MRIEVQSRLAAPPDRVWDELQTSALLAEVAYPFVTIRAAGAAPLPERWQAGTTLLVRSYLLGMIPLGLRILYWERIDPRAGVMQTRENDALIRKWDHRLSVQAAPDGQTLYTDRIDLEAGPLTPAVGLLARWFYRHRHRRWQRVARRLRGSTARRCSGPGPLRSALHG